MATRSPLALAVLVVALIVGLFAPATSASLERASPERPLVEWVGDRAVATLPSGATITLTGGSVEHALDSDSVEIPLPSEVFVNGERRSLLGIQEASLGRDDFDDGLFQSEVAFESDGLVAKRSLTVLEGTRHSDTRLTLAGESNLRLSVDQRVLLDAPADSEFVLLAPSGPRYVPADDVEGLRVERGDATNLGFAVVDAAAGTAMGVVFAGHLAEVTVSRDADRILLTAEYEARGSLQAAAYVTASRIEADDAAPHRFVEDLAHQDASEIGVAYLDQDRAAAVPWTSGGARIVAAIPEATSDGWDWIHPKDHSWRLAIEATSEANGKPVRLLGPSALFDAGRMEWSLDGLFVTPQEVPTGIDGVAARLLAIPHFSLRIVEIKTVTPGVSPLFLGLALLLGTVMGTESFFLGRMALRSRAAARGATEEPRSAAVARALVDTDAPRSAAVARALGPESGPTRAPGPAGAATTGVALPGLATIPVRSGAVQRAGAAPAAPAAPPRSRYARCTKCASPIRFDPDQTTVACPKCNTVNPRLET